MCARFRWWKCSRPFTSRPSRGPWNDGGGKLPRARLSATFPFVTPAARAPLACKQFHLIDGGYYDNYGISSLLEWLNDALSNPADPQRKIRRVLIIQIRGFSTKDTTELRRHGWFYQTYAPLAGLLHVRKTGQLSRNDYELELFKKYWATQNVAIESPQFEYQGDSPSLSWHLTPQEKKNINDEWCLIADGADSTKGANWETVKNYLALGEVLSKDCGLPDRRPSADR